MAPFPLIEVATGQPSNSANSCNSFHASDRITPAPATTSGFRALSNACTAWSTDLGVGCLPHSRIAAIAAVNEDILIGDLIRLGVQCQSDVAGAHGPGDRRLEGLRKVLGNSEPRSGVLV
jgi:hypothetical protein